MEEEEEEDSSTPERVVPLRWRWRQADGGVTGKKKGCVGIVEVRRWRMWTSGC